MPTGMKKNVDVLLRRPSPPPPAATAHAPAAAAILQRQATIARPLPTTNPAMVTKEMRELIKKYAVLCDFMSYFHKTTILYASNHQFTQGELRSITPTDIVKWMNFKLYNKEKPGEGDIPARGSYHTLTYYKAAIGCFMPQKDRVWNEGRRAGNPLRSKEVNALIKAIKEIDKDNPQPLGRREKAQIEEFDAPQTALKRRKLQAVAHARQEPPPARPGGPPDPAADPRPKQIAETLLRSLKVIHAQNGKFIDILGALGRALDQFRTALMDSGLAIAEEIKTLHEANNTNPVVSAGSNDTKPREHAYPDFLRGEDNSNESTDAAMSEAGQRKDPPELTHFLGFEEGGDSAAEDAPRDPADWTYVHPDGIRRRVPPTWTVPNTNIQELYLLWHCGDYRNRISPMKSFQNADVAFLGKIRGEKKMTQIRNLVGAIDREAARNGHGPTSGKMSMNNAVECFTRGIHGIKLSATTPMGRQRNIMEMKWSTFYKHASDSLDLDKTKRKEKSGGLEGGGGKETFEKDESDTGEIDEANMPENDCNWFYYIDGGRRRVPSSYKFPAVNLEEICVLWHCGDRKRNISPMKGFSEQDVANVVRGKELLAKLKKVMTAIDEAASKAGMGEVTEDMSPREAISRCRAGYGSLGIRTTTPKGRPREVLRLSWITAAGLMRENAAEEGKAEENEGEGDEEEADDEEEAEELSEAHVDI